MVAGKRPLHRIVIYHRLSQLNRLDLELLLVR